MAVVKMHLLKVVRRFPAHEMIIKRLYREDGTFQTICEDFGNCCDALERWRQSALEDAPARKRDYETLLQDLEEEILQYLFEH